MNHNLIAIQQAAFQANRSALQQAASLQKEMLSAFKSLTVFFDITKALDCILTGKITDQLTKWIDSSLISFTTVISKQDSPIIIMILNVVKNFLRNNKWGKPSVRGKK